MLQAELEKTLKEVTMPAYLNTLNGMLTKNGGKYFVGKGVRLTNALICTGIKYANIFNGGAFHFRFECKLYI